MPTIQHFEIPADNVERVKKFYADLFGWTYETMPGMDYTLIRTKDHKGEPGLGGGIMRRMHPQQGITNYVTVESVNAYATKAQQLGGEILVPRHEIPGAGAFAVLQDTEGNVIALWEPAPGSQPC